MRAESLRTFLAVERRLNYTRAARELHLSQPAVWRQVRQLEQELGVPLFEQVGKQLHVTDAGRTLAREAAEVIGRLSRLEEAVRAHASEVGGRLRVGASTTPGYYLLPKVLGSFHRRHPDVELSYQVENSAVIERMLVRNELDLGFLGSEVRSPELLTEKLADDEIICFAAPSHPLAARPRVRARDLLAETCVLREEGSATRRLFEGWIQGAAGRLERTLVIRCPEALKTVVAAGVGFSFLSKHGVKDAIARGTLRQLDVSGMSLPRSVAVAWHPGKHLSRPMEAFLDVCRRTLKGAGARAAGTRRAAKRG